MQKTGKSKHRKSVKAGIKARFLFCGNKKAVTEITAILKKSEFLTQLESLSIMTQITSLADQLNSECTEDQ